VTIIAHSLGGNIALRYTGLYPENVRCIVAIEGLGLSPEMLRKRHAKPLDERLRDWIEEQRGLAGRLPRRYPSIEDAFRRMQEENKHLSPEQARHQDVDHRSDQYSLGCTIFQMLTGEMPYYMFVNVAHNDYVELAVESGFVGLALWLLLLYGAFRTGTRLLDGGLYVEATGLATFPDGTVVCGALEQHGPSPRATALNPTVLLEVTSDSSEEFDLGAKLEAYQTIPSLSEYVVVSHRERRITVFVRHGDGAWRSTVAISGGRVRVGTVDAELDVDTIYAKSSVP